MGLIRQTFQDCTRFLNGLSSWLLLQEKTTSGLARFYLLSAGTLAEGRESVWALETLLVKMQKGFDEK